MTLPTLIACDVDGTLIGDDERISPRTRNAVRAAVEAGAQFVLATGRPHSVLPLSGVTHMASQEDVAENLLLLQVDFLRTALGIEARHGGDAR